MRIPAVVAAATALTLGLGATVALGFTAAASPDGWTYTVTSDPLYPDGELTFEGTYPEIGAPLVITVGSDNPSCEYGGTEAPFTYDCTLDPAGNFALGEGTVLFTIGSDSHSETFTVVPRTPTIGVTSGPIYPNGTLTFGGTQDLQAPIESISVGDADLTFGEDCNMEAATWSCSFTPGNLPEAGGTIWAYWLEGASVSTPFSILAYPTVPHLESIPGYGEISSTAEPAGPLATKVAIQLYSYYYDDWDYGYWEQVAGACPSAALPFDGTGSKSCDFGPLIAGIYNVYSQQDIGDGVTAQTDAASEYFVIPDTPYIVYASLNDDFSVHFVLNFGDGDLPGSTIRISLDGEDVTCPIDFDEWYGYSCDTEQEFDNGATYEFTAYAVDEGDLAVEAINDADYRDGGMSELSDTEAVTIAFPEVGYTFAPGQVTVETETVEPGTVARSDLFSFEYASEEGYDFYDETWSDSCAGNEPSGFGEGGWEWDGSPFDGVVHDQDNFGCTFDLTSGVWLVESQQDDGLGLESSGDVADDYFFVPDVPEITGATANDDGTVTLEGYGDYSFPILVFDSEGDSVCGDPVSADEGGFWSCTTGTLALDSYIFSAAAIDLGAGEGSLPYGNAGYQFGAISPLSEAAEVDDAGVSYLPIMTYEFGPASVYASGDPTGDATVVRIDLFSYDDSLSYPYSFVWENNCGGPAGPVYVWSPGSANALQGITENACAFGGLEPGIWNLFSEQDNGDGTTPEYQWVDDYFVVPVAPTIETTATNPNRTITISGTTVPGNAVHVVRDQDDLAVACDSLPSDEDGDWSCTTPAFGAGTYGFKAYSEDLGVGLDPTVPDSIYWEGGLSGFSAVSLATISAPPATPPTPPTPPAGPTTPPLIVPSWFFTLAGIDLSDMHPGDTFVIKGSGLPPGSVISAELHSTPVSLGTATVASNGTFSLSATVPEETEAGDHAVVVTLTGPGLEPTTVEQAVKVTTESESAGHSAEGSAGAEDAHGESSAANDLHEASVAPNILTNSMNPIIDVLNDPARIPAAFAAGIVLIIFALLPAHLLNSTIAEQYERLVRRLPRLGTAPKWYTALAAGLAKAPVLGGIALMAATGFLFAFADPHFGFNLHSLRLIIALSAALFVVFFVANGITGAIMRRVWNVDVVVRLRPAGLILTVVGVIISRILEFSPGFLIGIVLGLSIASSAAAEHAWKAVLIRASVVTTFGIASWIIYSSIADGVHHDPTFLNEVILEFFVAIATEGIVLLLVELLPLHMLEGERLYKKSRLLWAAAYAVVVTVFILAVVPWEGNWRELGESFWPWFTTVAIFGAVCVAIYLFFRFIAPPLHHEVHEDNESELENDDERIAVGNDS